jgi:hypothetical protein
LVPATLQRELSNTFHHQTFNICQAIVLNNCPEILITSMQQNARLLLDIFQQTNNFLLQRTRKNPLPPYNDLYDQLQKFDAQWTVFEQELCTYCFPPVQLKRDLEYDFYFSWLKKTLIKSIKMQLLSPEDVKDCDPSIFIALPRLSIAFALDHQIINAFCDPQSGIWFLLQGLRYIPLIVKFYQKF